MSLPWCYLCALDTKAAPTGIIAGPCCKNVNIPHRRGGLWPPAVGVQSIPGGWGHPPLRNVTDLVRRGRCPQRPAGGAPHPFSPPHPSWLRHATFPPAWGRQQENDYSLPPPRGKVPPKGADEGGSARTHGPQFILYCIKVTFCLDSLDFFLISR